MNYICTLLILFSSIGHVFSQDKVFDNASKYRIGFGIGPNYNNFRGNDYFNELNSRLNITAGVLFEYRISEKLSLLTNLNYELNTIKNEYSTLNILNLNTVTSRGPLPPWSAFQNGNVEIEELSRFHYLNIPFLVRHYFGYQDEFFINTGFFYNRLLYANTNRKFSEDLNTNVFFIDPEDFFLDHDIGIIFGLGTNFKISSTERIFLEFRYDLGLSNVVENLPKTYTSALTFIASWSFDL